MDKWYKWHSDKAHIALQAPLITLIIAIEAVSCLYIARENIKQTLWLTVTFELQLKKAQT